ncbi:MULTISPECIES: diphosphomevalonate decarboxylase [Staphylococcus]|uniref:diphosphomevalonate decarboxylase n=1 Tax=Staphylococcus haemolyticus TaxID=1283 RepID=A0A2J8BDW1_STAHA|nr:MULTISPECIES: diphosphomevalonate decarboxylase [Staphylococcus]MBY6180305.1 diphosphomevalonate decarboxylase [Staphylococcaceae bacterium DP2N0-1]KGF25634.1 diphosphomevalonate decarboxylase [Staphylococcus haemolyticus DNF00585]KGJ26391.1 diphosphomevalonate decarboxylase [Staphylococcus haemolyticus]KGJ28556.1 diphosphomevalonate decarboxylase [Staphylococcus haemolyticus]MBF9289957.1 diphosphomevalonate decarboxylase [Staphylococcus haemolyticus]
MKKSGKARAHTNIALIKYWGKADEALIIPMNNSLSVTLDRFYTETRVTFDETLTEDQLILNGEAVNAKESAKIQRYMEMIRKEAGISEHALIESENFVPTAAGLASSASAYAALAGACNEALQLGLSDKDLSRLARRGSGSASRSIYGGFAEWEKGHDDESSFAHRIEADGWENELAMVFVVINNKSKKVSSRSGMSLTRDTSRFYQYWLDNVEPDLKETKEAIAQKDFKRMGEVIEANGLRMHATNLGAQPPFTYLVPESYDAMRIVHECREAGLPCYFTMDAGPNVKVLIEKKNQQAIVNKFLQEFDQSQIITSDITQSGVEIIK